jgi:hypothetical protein
MPLAKVPLQQFAPAVHFGQHGESQHFVQAEFEVEGIHVASFERKAGARPRVVRLKEFAREVGRAFTSTFDWLKL